LLAPRQTPIPEDQASIFIPPIGRVATHFSRLLRHAWVTVGLFLFPGHHTGNTSHLLAIIVYAGLHALKCFIMCSCHVPPSPVKLFRWPVFRRFVVYRMIGVQFPAGAGNFSLRRRVQTGSEAHPASYPMDTGGYFPGGKAAGA
jgi:hypothetical protein